MAYPPAYVFAAIYILVDIVYVMLSQPTYARVVRRISGEPMPTGRASTVVAAIGSYAVMALGWLVLVVPAVASLTARGMARWLAGLVAGLVYGLVIYGVFNGTLHAMFRGWDGSIILRDMAWGLSWTTLVTVLFAATR